MKNLKNILLISGILLINFLIILISTAMTGIRDYSHKSISSTIINFTSLSNPISKGHWKIINKINYKEIKKSNIYGNTTPANLLFIVYIAGFHTESFGITAGPDDDVRYTTDGGKSWTKSPTALWCRKGLDIVNENVVWHGGNGGTKVTLDGCQTWRIAAGEKAHHTCLSFLNSKTGWAASPYSMQSTTNGGITWNNIKLPKDIELIAGINLRTEKNGYILDTKGRLYVTKDGAKSWKVHSLGLKTTEHLIASLKGPMAAIRFFDDKHGMIVYDLLDKDKTVWFALTQDGGQNWQRNEIKELQNQTTSYLNLYLSRDGKLLTATDESKTDNFNKGGNISIVMRYQ